MRTKKYLLIFGLLVWSLVGCFFLIIPSSTYAAEGDLILQIPVPDHKNPSTYTNKITLCDKGTNGELTCNGISNYVGGMFIWLVRAVAIIAVIVLMVGGLQWLTARGDAGQITKAKTIISNALIGLVLTLGSYTILYFINPALTEFPALNLGKPVTEEQKLTISEIESDSESKEARHTGSTTLNGSSASLSEVVPYDTNKVITYQGAGKLRPETAEMLKKAGQNCSKPIHIISSWRSYEKQLALWNGYVAKLPGYNVACNPGSDPAKVYCPHTSGQAVDISHYGNSCDPVWVACMKNAGFCQLSFECWHFEYPIVSTSACK